MPGQNILLVGCGDVATRLGIELSENGAQVYGLRRNTAQLPSGFIPISADVTQPATLGALRDTVFERVVITLTARGEQAYQSVYVDGLCNVLNALAENTARPYIVFASSTSVYAQNDGEIVDEDSATMPLGYSGKTMLAAEQLLWESPFPTTAIRFSGIYGDSRGGHLAAVLREGRISPETPLRYSNRIHVADCVAMISHLFQRYSAGLNPEPCYLGSDMSPAPLHEVMQYLAQRLGLDGKALTADYLPARGGNKRCSSARLQSEGFSFRYPSYREGYALEC